MTSDARTRDWLDPFTHQTYRAVPVRLADRLDAIAAPAVWRPTMTHSIELSRRREEIREQLKRLLSAFGHRVAYRRMIDEIHAGEDGLLPISEDRRAELRNLADTFAGLRDLDVVFAVQDGASVEDAALAAGITLEDAQAAFDNHDADDKST